MQAARVRTDYLKFSQGLRWLDDLRSLSALQELQLLGCLLKHSLFGCPELHFFPLYHTETTFQPFSPQPLASCHAPLTNWMIAQETLAKHIGVSSAHLLSLQDLSPPCFLPIPTRRLVTLPGDLLTAKSHTLCHLRAGRFCGCWGKIKAYLN